MNGPRRSWLSERVPIPFSLIVPPAPSLLSDRQCCVPISRYGLKKTTIEDLVKLVGIAKSSFYLFFESKEALYVELMMSELPAMVQRLVDVSFGVTDDTREALILLLDRKSTRLNSSHTDISRMPSSA